MQLHSPETAVLSTLIFNAIIIPALIPLSTIVQLDIERNKVSNVLVFAPLYMNVLQVNLDLVTAYPKIYQEFNTNTNEVS
jgi:hypothetical protein